MESKALARDMQETQQDNLEHTQGVGKSRDITEMEAYDPTQKIGADIEHARDAVAGDAKRSTKESGTATTAVKDGLPRSFMVPKDLSDDAPAAEKRVIINAPANRINTSQVTVGANPTRVIFDTAERMSVIVVNNDSTNAVYIGANSAMSEYNGFRIEAGASMTLAINCELWAVSPAGAIVSAIEFLL